MPIHYKKHGHVGVVTLSRPEARNAWGQDYYDGMVSMFAEMEEDDEIRCAVITGDDRGGAFSAGAFIKDPKTHSVSGTREFMLERVAKRHKHPIFLLGQFPKPVIAAVNGYAIGIGCIVTFCCDLIVASERAEWRLPQVNLGILPAMGGSPRLARWVGKGNAMKVAMGFPLKADEAHRIGLAQWLVPHEKLMDQAMEVAEEIASRPPLASRMVKESMTHGLDVPNASDAALTDLYRFMALELTDDKEEAHAAWREKRAPAFKGA